MDRDSLILLIDDSTATLDSIRQYLGDRSASFRWRRVADVSTALARIWGGGVDLVLFNLQPAETPVSERLTAFLELRKQAPGAPVILICGSGEESLGATAVGQGAADYLIRETLDVNLPRVLAAFLNKADAPPLVTPAPGKSGKVIAFMGSKGGVGTTTVAINVAASLAQHHKVILADLHSELGTLPHYFDPHRFRRDIGDLLDSNENTQAEAEECLWTCKSVPGLQVLFGPRNLEHPKPLSPEKARDLLGFAAVAADYVVADLPSSVCATARAVIESCDFLTLVADWDSISIQAAKLILDSIDSWNSSRFLTGVVLVNRSAVLLPMPISEIESQLSMRLLAVIPPAADLCAAAQAAHIPLLDLDADSLASLELRQLAGAICQLIPGSNGSAREAAGPRLRPISQSKPRMVVR